MRKLELPFAVSDGRVDGFVKIINEIRSGSHPSGLNLCIKKKTSITPAGYAILEVIKATCLEYNCPLKWSPSEPKVPDKYLVKTLGPGISAQVSTEVESLFSNLTEKQIFRTKMILNELMQNAADHSGSEKYILYMGQFDKELHVGCLDRGVTIPSKLNQKYDISTDLEFIEHSLVHGVTTRRVRKGGLGLTHVFDYAKLEKGRLVILSRNAQLRRYFHTRKSQKQKLKFALHGTWVMVRFLVNEKN